MLFRSANGGFGAWRSDFSQTSSQSSRFVKFTCSRIGYFGLQYEENRANEAVIFNSKWHHPVLYAGTCVLFLLLLPAVVIFAAKMPVLEMANDLKHTLINLWISFGLLIYLFVMGIYQFNHEVTCRIVVRFFKLYLYFCF